MDCFTAPGHTYVEGPTVHTTSFKTNLSHSRCGTINLRRFSNPSVTTIPDHYHFYYGKSARSLTQCSFEQYAILQAF